MSRHLQRITALIACGMMLATGCAPSRTFYFHDAGDLRYYKDVATEMEAPEVCTDTLDDVRFARRPLSIENYKHDEFWNLTLEEAVNHALHNSKIVRHVDVPLPKTALVGLGGSPDTLTRSAGNSILATTIYDPAIQESGTGGVEQALSAFDAQLGASMFWERNERPINVNQPATQIFARNFEQDRATFQSQLSKTAANGSRFFAGHNVFYDMNNNPTREIPNDYTANFEFGVTQPLLQGAGTTFNRIAGPNGAPGVYNGVSIARINNDISLADFEAAVRNLVADVENAYWELSFAYRALDATRKARDVAQEYWLRLRDLPETDAADEAQARALFFRLKSETEWFQADLFTAENRLRYLLGIAATDTRLIRPGDEPTTAKIAFSWEDIHLEAICRTPELRRQKWRIKQKELELIASRNFLLPRLDAVALYRFLGAGDELIDPNGRGVFPFEGSNAYSTLTDGNYQEWQVGFNLSMPLGYRRELASVRNAQLQLARERALLQDQELEVSHLLSEAVRKLESWYAVTHTRFNSWLASRDEAAAFRANEAAGREVPVIEMRDAIEREARAEAEYFRALINYNRAITEVHLRKGSLLEYNGVLLAEGPWPRKAYCDARRRAHERSAAMRINYGLTRPCVFSQGPTEQFPFRHGGGEPAEAWQEEMVPTPVEGESPAPPENLLPAPAPEPTPADAGRNESAQDGDAGPELLEPLPTARRESTPPAVRRAGGLEAAADRTAAAEPDEPAGPQVRFASSVRVVESKVPRLVVGPQRPARQVREPLPAEKRASEPRPRLRLRLNGSTPESNREAADSDAAASNDGWHKPQPTGSWQAAGGK